MGIFSFVLLVVNCISLLEKVVPNLSEPDEATKNPDTLLELHFVEFQTFNSSQTDSPVNLFFLLSEASPRKSSSQGTSLVVAQTTWAIVQSLFLFLVYTIVRCLAMPAGATVVTCANASMSEKGKNKDTASESSPMDVDISSVKYRVTNDRDPVEAAISKARFEPRPEALHQFGSWLTHLVETLRPLRNGLPEAAFSSLTESFGGELKTWARSVDVRERLKRDPAGVIERELAPKIMTLT